jgi:hypothetical protein
MLPALSSERSAAIKLVKGALTVSTRTMVNTADT